MIPTKSANFSSDLRDQSLGVSEGHRRQDAQLDAVEGGCQQGGERHHHVLYPRTRRQGALDDTHYLLK